MRDDLDRFYTKSSVAQKCIESVSAIANDFDLVIEPSAGGGSFSDLIPECKAFDISPSKETIIKKDWLTVQKSDFDEYKNLLVIGNPPFGTRSVLAKKFIEHSIKALNAQTIAFILPKTFNKKTSQKVFPNNWRLIHIISLEKDENTFDLYEEDEIFIPCDFFVWTCRDDILPDLDLRKKDVMPPEEIIFVSRGSSSADFSINGNNGRVKNIDQITNPKAEHYIQVHPLFDKNEVRSFVEGLSYNFHSSVNGGVAWINKDDISESFNKAKLEQNIVFAQNSIDSLF